MLLAINIIVFCTLLFVIFQDLKYRSIHVALPIVLFIAALGKFFLLEGPATELITTAIFLSIVLIVLFVYVSIKSKKIINPIDGVIGLGDIVFFVAIIPLFYSTSYVLYFTTGMFFSVLCHFLFNKRKAMHVPLAGYLSIYLLILSVIGFITEKELFYTHYLLSIGN